MKEKIKKHKKNILVGLGITIFLAGLIVALVIISPEIKLSNIKVQSAIQTDEEVLISSNTSDFDLKLDGTHRITLPSGKQLIADSYSYTQTDFSEGENTIKLEKYNNLIFAKLVSNEQIEIKVFVDRIAPTVETITPAKQFYLLEDANITVKSELGSIVKLGVTIVKTIENEPETLVIPTTDGDNEVNLTIEDGMGNKTPLEPIKFYAFKKEGYEKVQCRGTEISIISSSFSGDRTCTGNYILLNVTKNVPEAERKCGDTCIWVSENIILVGDGIVSADEHYNRVVGPIGNPNVAEDKQITAKSGFTGRYLQVNYGTGETAVSWKYIFSNSNGEALMLMSNVGRNHSAEYIEKNKNEFLETINNLNLN